jgi:hypothetical protein
MASRRQACNAHGLPYRRLKAHAELHPECHGVGHRPHPHHSHHRPNLRWKPETLGIPAAEARLQEAEGIFLNRRRRAGEKLPEGLAKPVVRPLR